MKKILIMLMIFVIVSISTVVIVNLNKPEDIVLEVPVLETHDSTFVHRTEEEIKAMLAEPLIK